MSGHRHEGPVWLVYGLATSRAGITLVIEPSSAARYAALGFDVREVTTQAPYYEVRCAVPPAGWYCTREARHDGPCAARPVNPC